MAVANRIAGNPKLFVPPPLVVPPSVGFDDVEIVYWFSEKLTDTDLSLVTLLTVTVLPDNVPPLQPDVEYPVLGVAVNVAVPPEVTVTEEGVIDPPEPALAVTVKYCTKLALIECPDVTLLNVYELIAPCDTPSTVTFDMLYPVFGVIEND